jgi:hypothetical protein
VRRLTTEAADNGLLDPAIAAAIARVHGLKCSGVRLSNWLDEQHAAALLITPAGDSLRGKRDRAVLALLFGAGMRRSEVAGVVVEKLKVIEERWVIADLTGKGRRIRTVPIPTWAMAVLNDWLGAAGITAGPIFRPIDKTGRVCNRALVRHPGRATLRHRNDGREAWRGRCRATHGSQTKRQRQRNARVSCDHPTTSQGLIEDGIAHMRPGVSRAASGSLSARHRKRFSHAPVSADLCTTVTFAEPRAGWKTSFTRGWSRSVYRSLGSRRSPGAEEQSAGALAATLWPTITDCPKIRPLKNKRP